MSDKPSSKVLALDTSSENCSVTLKSGASYYSLCEPAPRSHTQLILPMVKKVLAHQKLDISDIDALAYGCGPGSFTGIRIAAGISQGLGFGLSCPVYAISSLEALALQHHHKSGAEYVLVAIDARMDEVYWSLCRISEATNANGVAIKKLETLLGEHVAKPELVDISPLESLAELKTIEGVGSGFEFFERFPQLTQSTISSFDAKAQPESKAICELAEHRFEQGANGSLIDAMPSYVRDTITWKKLPGRE